MSIDALFNLRNRLLTSARFRSWAQKLPVTQWVAKRRSEQLFRLCSGFIHSQVLLACVRLDLFERLRAGPMSVEDIIAGSELGMTRGEHLLRAAAALKLLERRPNGDYGIGVLGAAMTGNESLGALVRHHALLYEDLVDPVALFREPDRKTRMSRLWPYASSGTPDALSADDVAAYTALMATSQTMVAEQVLDAYALNAHENLLDIGGGAGTFVMAAASRWPNLRLTLADLPAVAGIARQRMEEKGLDKRIHVLAIDATRNDVPPEYDIVSLVRIVHDHDDERALRILETAHGALQADGTLLVAEPLADAPGAGALIDAYFNVYLLAMGSGRPRTFDEIAVLLERAGFRRIRRRRTRVPLITSVIVAKR